VIAIIINYAKRPDLRTTSSAATSGGRRAQLLVHPLWLVLALPALDLVIPGWIAYVVIGLWYLYRFIRGWLALASNQPDADALAGLSR